MTSPILLFLLDVEYIVSPITVRGIIRAKIVINIMKSIIFELLIIHVGNGMRIKGRNTNGINGAPVSWKTLSISFINFFRSSSKPSEVKTLGKKFIGTKCG